VAVANHWVERKNQMADVRPEKASRAADGKPPPQFGTVFYVTVGISAAFVLAGILFTEPFGSALAAVVDQIINSLGWLYLLITTVFLVFVLYLAFSRFGRIRLGGRDAKPEFGLIAWFCMLFQAGMGIGLLFWGVAEPLLHYRNPPLGLAEPGTPEAADLAMQYALFHWTLHPWAIYAVVGLAVAYFSFNKGVKSLRISSVLRPLIGDRVEGPIGKAVDVLAIVATLFGVAVSLGLGTLQINAGLGAAFGLPSGLVLQLAIIAVTAAAYLLSASTPIEKGINWLSQASMVLAVILLLYFLAGVGPTLLVLNTFTQEIGGYLANLIPMSLRTSAFEPTPWLGDWTIFFWATWIAWAPYVGAFIARISRGRTIRQFILGVLIAPSVFTVLWFSVFGAAGIEVDNRVGGAISGQAAEDEAVALFAFLEQYPGTLIISVLAIVLTWIFFVAGADAGTVVLGSMSGGVLNPRVTVKLTWGVIMAALAAILLAVGGLDALQNGAILAATPFGILMLAICWSLHRELAHDHREQQLVPLRRRPATDQGEQA
jgi:glycine betaine transporter